MKITGTTKVIGIIGWPVSHSLSPVMHNAAFEFLGIDYCYVPFAIKAEHLNGAMAAFSALNIVGLNVTVPHKESVLKSMSELSEAARMIGAVNTIKCLDNRLIGYNTDGVGFTGSLKEVGYPVTGHILLILGSGGAAKAVAFQSVAEGAKEIIIANRTISKAVALKNHIEGYFPLAAITAIGIGVNELKGVIDKVDTVINTTSLGLDRGSISPIPVELLHKGLFVCDLIYNPSETTLLRYAKELGCGFINGIGMLVHQGAESFRLWTGLEPPIDVMRKAVEDALLVHKGA